MVVAVLVAVLGVEWDTIIEEYLLSDGGVDRRWIEMALDGIGVPGSLFPSRRSDAHPADTRRRGWRNYGDTGMRTKQ